MHLPMGSTPKQVRSVKKKMIITRVLNTLLISTLPSLSTTTVSEVSDLILQMPARCPCAVGDAISIFIADCGTVPARKDHGRPPVGARMRTVPQMEQEG
jgi:hypothetical protein